MAEHRGVSPLLVGLTVVAFGTSAPELVVSTAAVLRGQSGIAVRERDGLDGCERRADRGPRGARAPDQRPRKLLQREAPLMVLILAAVMVFASNGVIGFLDGLTLVVGFTIYMLYLIRWGKSETETGQFQAARIDAGVKTIRCLARRPYMKLAAGGVRDGPAARRCFVDDRFGLEKDRHSLPGTGGSGGSDDGGRGDVAAGAGVHDRRRGARAWVTSRSVT